MPTTQDILERIQAWKEQVGAHAAKIQQEAQLPEPRDGLIRHWLREIENHLDLTARSQRRLPGRRRRRR